MNNFIETAVLVGRTYLFCCLPLVIIAGAIWLLWHRHILWQLLDYLLNLLIGATVVCFVFILPGMTIGAYLGDVIGAHLIFIRLFQWAGFFIGLFIGAKVWWYVGRRSY